MPPTFHHDLRDDDHDDFLQARGGGEDGVRVLRTAPKLTPQAFRLPPLRRRPAASLRAAPSMFLRRPRRWLQLCGGTVMGLLVGLLVGMTTR